MYKLLVVAAKSLFQDGCYSLRNEEKSTTKNKQKFCFFRYLIILQSIF